MTTYKVLYSGGESRTKAHMACDFMLVELEDEDRNDIWDAGLYAERVYPDGVEYDSDEYRELESQFEAELKAEIIQQAAEHGISAERLIFVE